MTEADTGRDLRVPELARFGVVELANGVAGAMAGRYFAGFGASVTRVVSPALGTHPGGLSAPEYADVPPEAAVFLTEGKHVVDLDLTRAGDVATLVDLLGSATLLIEQLTPAQRAALPPDYRRAREARADLVVVSLSPFGTDGPLAGWAATELVVDAMGGWLQNLGEPGRGPVRPPGHQSEVMAALAAVTASIPSIMRAGTTGRGEVIDVSAREAVTWFQMNPTTVYEYSGSLSHRTGGASDVNYPQGIFHCADGLVGINILYYVEWFRFCDLLGQPSWKDDPRLATPLLRHANHDVIDEVLLPWLAERDADTVYAEGQGHRLPFARVNSPADLLASAQLRDREFWRTGRAPDGRELVLPSLPARFES